MNHVMIQPDPSHEYATIMDHRQLRFTQVVSQHASNTKDLAPRLVGGPGRAGAARAVGICGDVFRDEKNEKIID